MSDSERENWRRRALAAEAHMGMNRGNAPGRYVLHRCPNCARVFSTPSICADDGSRTEPEPRSNVSDPVSFIAGGGVFIPRPSGISDEAWGEYVEQEIGERFPDGNAR